MKTTTRGFARYVDAGSSWQCFAGARRMIFTISSTVTSRRNAKLEHCRLIIAEGGAPRADARIASTLDWTLTAKSSVVCLRGRGCLRRLEQQVDLWPQRLRVTNVWVYCMWQIVNVTLLKREAWCRLDCLLRFVATINTLELSRLKAVMGQWPGLESAEIPHMKQHFDSGRVIGTCLYLSRIIIWAALHSLVFQLV